MSEKNLSDAFVTLPGGFGTFGKFKELVTWRQLAIREKSSGILNLDGYFADVLALVAHAVEMGFIRPHNAAQITVSDDPETLLDSLATESRLP